MVIVMIAVLSAMVVPSITHISGGSVEDEANRLRTVMRLALEESQLSGLALRFVATKHGWSFEYLEQGEKGRQWSAYEDEQLGAYDLPGDIVIASVKQAVDFALEVEVAQAENKEEDKPVVGMVLLLPDGTTSQTNITIADEAGGFFKVLQVRPGPSGIRFQKEEQ